MRIALTVLIALHAIGALLLARMCLLAAPTAPVEHQRTLAALGIAGLVAGLGLVVFGFAELDRWTAHWDVRVAPTREWYAELGVDYPDPEHPELWGAEPTLRLGRVQVSVRLVRVG